MLLRRRARCLATQDGEPVRRSIGSKKLRNGALVAARPGQELHRPLGDALLRDVPVNSALGFVDVLALPH